MFQWTKALLRDRSDFFHFTSVVKMKMEGIKGHVIFMRAFENKIVEGKKKIVRYNHLGSSGSDSRCVTYIMCKNTLLNLDFFKTLPFG